MLVPHHVMLVQSRLDFSEVKARVWVEGEVDPVLAINPQVADEEAFGSARQVEYSNYLVDLIDWRLGNRAFRAD